MTNEKKRIAFLSMLTCTFTSTLFLIHKTQKVYEEIQHRKGKEVLEFPGQGL